MRRYKTFLSILICSIFVLSSCVSRKEITYFQPVDENTDSTVTEIANTYIPRIQEGDILSIAVSSISKEANEMFNPYPAASVNAMYQSAGTIAPAPAIGFLVDKSGNIQLPMVGSLYVKGMTITEATNKITAELEKYLKSPTVNIYIANYKVSVLGEVARPAVYTIPNEIMTLPQAIAFAGDLTVYGRRDNILIIREENGKRIFTRVDLRNRDIFDSDYYYLRPNDIVYVEAKKSKAMGTDQLYLLTPIVMSTLTLVLTLVNVFK